MNGAHFAQGCLSVSCASPLSVLLQFCEEWLGIILEMIFSSTSIFMTQFYQAEAMFYSEMSFLVSFGEVKYYMMKFTSHLHDV